MKDSYRIEALQPTDCSFIDVIVPVAKEAYYGEGERFRRAFLDGGPGSDGVSHADLEGLAAAFVTVAGSLPITNGDMIAWLCNSSAFGGERALREFAECQLGMTQVRPAIHGVGANVSLCVGGDVLFQQSITPAQLIEIAKWAFDRVPWSDGEMPNELTVDITENPVSGRPTVRVELSECRPGVDREWIRNFAVEGAVGKRDWLGEPTSERADAD